MTTRTTRSAAAGAALGAALFALPAPARAVEEPAHVVVKREGAFELRDYPEMTLASVEMRGEAVAARNDGFMPLANYIFARERPGKRPGGEIAMTAPVTQTRRPKIEMTAPVTQTAAGETWRVSFIMPREWSLEALPAPLNPDVELAREPARRMAVVRYSWLAGAERMAQKEAELRRWIGEQGLATVGEAVHAFYDPPWTPPFARRNEVMIEIAPAG